MQSCSSRIRGIGFPVDLSPYLQQAPLLGYSPLSCRRTRATLLFAHALAVFVGGVFGSRIALQLEVVALRQQLNVYHRSIRRPRVHPGDRIFWARLARHRRRWRDTLVFVQPATVIGWQRKGFRADWTQFSWPERGRPRISPKLRRLIREMSLANPRWGAPRILGKLRKVGISVAKSTVEKFRVRPPRPPSPPWRAFLKDLELWMFALVSVENQSVATFKYIPISRLD